MASMNEKDYYAILEVDEKATTDEIRKAFQGKARKLHPDVNKEPDAEERFKEVSEAYAVLSDADKRKRYDAMRSGIPFAAGSGGYSGYGGATSAESPFGSGFPFGGSWSSSRKTSRSWRPRAGADVIYEFDMDLETAEAGTTRGVSYQRYAPCDVCHGTGSVEHAHPIVCPTCGGAGRMRIDLGGMGIFGASFFEMTCPECEGSGKVVADPCDSCGGTGRVYAASEVVVDIPAGSHDGDEVRVEGMGNAGTNGREAGDFVCQVCVEEERLTPGQVTGFRLIGFGLPLLALSVWRVVTMQLSGVGMPVTIFVLTAAALFFIILGVISLVKDGLRANAHWWSKGGREIVSGMTSGAVIALLVFLSGIFLAAPFVGFLILFFLARGMTRNR